jgi:hypothetical protein
VAGPRTALFHTSRVVCCKQTSTSTWGECGADGWLHSSLLRLPVSGWKGTNVPFYDCSKTRGMGAGRKLQIHRRNQRWADKDYKKSHLGSEWKKPFAGGLGTLLMTLLCFLSDSSMLDQDSTGQQIMQLLLLLPALLMHRLVSFLLCRCFPRQGDCPGEDVSHST